MTRLHKTILMGAALLSIAGPARIAAQNFDTSGTAGLSGRYLFRYVNFFNDQDGNLTESCTLTGVMTFDGKGNYTLSNTQLFDSAGTGGNGSCASLGSGSYGVQSNGIAQLDNPLYAATLYGAFSKPVLTASSTEDDYFDLLIAIEAPASSFSNSNLSGSYTLGMMDFPNASISSAVEGYFTINADGKGNISPFTVTGATAGSGSTSDNVGASTYTLSGTSGGTFNFGGGSQIVGGSKVLYVSADGNYILAGSTNGSDMIFGFRAPSGPISGSSYYGTYYIAGMDADLSGDCSNSSTYCLDAFYGSINSDGAGNFVWHQRFDDVVDIATYDATFNTSVPTGSNPPFDGTFYYLASANGQALMFIGSGTQFSLNLGVLAPAVTPTSKVWINPVGIVNAANYTPITNAYAPGEIVSLYGSFGVSSQQAQALPLPTDLNGVKVFVDGVAAPILFVSSDQINVIIPYELTGQFFDTFQVQANESISNNVTVYGDATAPGLFTGTENGLGEAAVVHGNGNPVTDNDPATPGETVALFVNGLGTVTPNVADGAAASSQPLSVNDEFTAQEIAVFLDDGTNFPQANVAFAGLAPGFAGLSQVNFTLPTSGLLNGDDYISFQTNEAANEMATIAVTGYSRGFATKTAHRRPRPHHVGKASVDAHTKADLKSPRRALPDRTRP